MHGESPKKTKCKGMEGVLAEGDELVGQDATPAVRDAAIISAAQRVNTTKLLFTARSVLTPNSWDTAAPPPYCKRRWMKKEALTKN